MAIFSLYELEPALPAVRVLDIGALDHPDFPPRYAPLVAAGRARVIGFEPDPQGCRVLNQKYGPPHRFLPLFVGAGGPAKFHRTTWADTGSLYRPNARVMSLFNDIGGLATVVEVIDIDTVRLDDVPDAVPVDYLKLDVQGAELDVLGGGAAALASAMMIQIEVAFVELYESQPLFGDVDVFLRRHGFWFHTLIDVASLGYQPIRAGTPDPGLNQRMWADAIYVRDPSKLDGLSAAQLRTGAVLAHDLFHSFDLAFRWLAEADGRDGNDLGARYLARMARP